MAEAFFMWCSGVMSVVAVLGLLGWLVKPRLIQWIRVEVIEPMQTIKKQVTENSHANPEPTVLDRLSDVIDRVEKTDRSVLALTTIVGNLDGKADRIEHKAERLDGKAERLERKVEDHLSWSKKTTDRINDRLDAVERPADDET